MENIYISGSGPRFEQLIQEAPSRFSVMSDLDENKLKVHIGNNPELDTNIWVKRTEKNNLQDIIDELKVEIRQNRHLEMVAVEYINLTDLMPDFHVLMAHDGVVRTFQTSQDLNNYLLQRFRLNLAF
jgi:hypothetical protein